MEKKISVEPKWTNEQRQRFPGYCTTVVINTRNHIELNGQHGNLAEHFGKIKYRQAP